MVEDKDWPENSLFMRAFTNLCVYWSLIQFAKLINSAHQNLLTF